MKPVIALVGRPNVGKSTLFNRMTKSRDAIVADFAGLTRDRHYGNGRQGQHEYIVIDTGGFEPDAGSGIFREMAKQTRQAVAEADVVVFVVDVRGGLSAQDHDIANYLRRLGKPCVLAGNKAEGMQDSPHLAEFYELGLGEVHPVSAAHGQGVRSLVELALEPLALPEVATNSPQRCYDCKTGLVHLLRGELAALACEGQGHVLCDGTNADDLRAYRPGLRALEEGRVRSPLAEAGLAKAAVREAARATGLDRPQQRARPCLLTRMAYGMRPDAATLARLAAAEDGLAHVGNPHEKGAESAGNAGSACKAEPAGPLGDFRLRLTPEPVLQAEKLPDSLRQQVQNILQGYGFWPCAMEIGGSISGFYDAGGAGHKS